MARLPASVLTPGLHGTGRPHRGDGPGLSPGDLTLLRAEHSSGSVEASQGDVLASLPTPHVSPKGRYVLFREIRNSQLNGDCARRCSEPRQRDKHGLAEAPTPFLERRCGEC